MTKQKLFHLVGMVCMSWGWCSLVHVLGFLWWEHVNEKIKTQKNIYENGYIYGMDLLGSIG